MDGDEPKINNEILRTRKNENLKYLARIKTNGKQASVQCLFMAHSQHTV